MERPKICEHCGQKYIARSTRSRFCSDSCRVANHAKRKKQQEKQPVEIVKKQVGQASRSAMVSLAKYWIWIVALVAVAWLIREASAYWHDEKVEELEQEAEFQEFLKGKIYLMAPDEIRKDFKEWAADDQKVFEEFQEWKRMMKKGD